LRRKIEVISDISLEASSEEKEAFIERNFGGKV